MSNPKEKAKELVEKMYFSEDQDGFHSMNKYRAKQCASIAVDELIKATVPLTSTYYWQEVKQAIKEL
jgi:hypothetical protein